MNETSPAGAGGRSSHPALLFAVIVAAMMIKLLLLYYVNSLPLIGDENKYWQKSLEVLGNYFSRLDYQAPLYFIYLAVNKIIWGDHALPAVRIEQVVLHSLEIYLIYLLAARYFSKRQALITGVIASFYPELAAYSYLIFSEVVFLAFFLPSVLLYFIGLKTNRGKGLACLAGSGVLYGLVSLTRSINFLFFPLIIIHLWIFKKGNLRVKIASLLALTLSMSGVVAIQTVKNYRVAHCLILIDTCVGDNLHKSYNLAPSPHYHGKFHRSKELINRPRCRAGNICQQTRCEIKNALEFIYENPGLTLGRAGYKALDLYSPKLTIFRNIDRKNLESDYSDDADDADDALEKAGERGEPAGHQALGIKVIGSGSYLVLILLALLGLFASPEWEFKSFTILLILYHTLVCAFYFAVNRYRMPFVPFLIVYAGYFLGIGGNDFRNLKRWKLLAAVILWSLLLGFYLPRLHLILQ